MPALPTIHTIDLLFQGTPGIVAAFLVEGPEGPVLIETGPGSTLPALLAGIEAAGYAPGDIGHVLVTHIHLDHAGAAGWWARQGAMVHAHPLGTRHLIDPSRLMDSARMVYGDAMETLWGEMLPAPADRIREVADGEVISVAGLEITALDTPGHARHHHCFAIGDTIFTGDAAGVRLPGCGYQSVTSAPPQFDPVAYEASIERLLGLAPERLYLTHFGVVEDPENHLEAYREAVALASRFVRERLAEGMDADSLQVAYQAHQMEQAFQSELPPNDWTRYQKANPTGMSADGIRLYWEKQSANPK